MKSGTSTAQTVLFCLIALAAAWGVKRHYSLAAPQDLLWILAPTAGLVETVTGHPFYFDPDVGYINPDLGIIIAPACAGVNFLIALFCLGFFSGIFGFSGMTARCLWLPASAAFALSAAVVVNALRIWISIFLITADIHWGWLSPDRVHRMAGIVIYFFFLCLFYPIIQKGIVWMKHREPAPSSLDKSPESSRNGRRAWAAPGIWPLICYWGISIGVPGLNAAYQKDPWIFTEHSLTVAAVSLLMAAAFAATTLFIKKQKIAHHET
jgi:exosortase K